MMITHVAVIGLALMIDTVLGDPRSNFHPVVLIGKLIAKLERFCYRQEGKKYGVFLLIVVIVVVFTITFALVYGAYFIHYVLGLIVEAMLISFSLARRSLKEAADEVYEPLQKNGLSEARLKLSYIVGRDTEHLEEEEIVRATVETVAENTTDGVTAPMFFALLGGAPLALVYRAVNTCDSMLGYKNEKYLHFGWASARCDDWLNWIPARLTGLLMMLTRMEHKHFSKQQAWRQWMIDAKKHPSPNGGWTEAAVALLLGIQLGGWNRYKGNDFYRETIGRETKKKSASDIGLAVQKMNIAVVSFYVLIVCIGGCCHVLAKTWS